MNATVIVLCLTILNALAAPMAAGLEYVLEREWPEEVKWRFEAPGSVAAGVDGDVYVFAYRSVQVYGPEGALRRTWNEEGMYSRLDVCVAPNGSVFALEPSSGGYYTVLFEFNADGALLNSWKDSTAVWGPLDGADGISASEHGLFLTHKDGNRIQEISFGGAYRATWGGAGTGEGLLQGPTDAVWGPDDRLYVADAGNHRIQAFDASRAFSAAFAPPAEAVAFQGDLSLAISDSTLFVADSGSHWISAFDLTGNLLRQWGGPGLPDSLGNDLDICCAGNRLFVADKRLDRVKVYDFSGHLVQHWGADAPGQFCSPESVAADGCGRIYVGDWANRMQCFDSEGAWLGQIGGRALREETLLGCAVGIALFDSNNLVIADFDHYEFLSFETIQEFTAFGAPVSDWGISAHYYWPRGITVDGAGDVYVSSDWNNTVVKANGQGQILDTWGGTGDEFEDDIGAGTGPGLFRWPSGVACDKAHGWIYVADGGNKRIQKFDTAGNYLLEWSRPGGVEDSRPYGICVDLEGRVFVTDLFNNVVQVFDSDGILLTEFGLPGANGRNLRGIAVDASGAVYVTDSVNHRVQKYVNPEAPSLPRFHSGDQNQDYAVSLTELLRVIQFFNLGGLHCDPAGEDGYAPGPGGAACAPHDSDYDGAPDWQISLTELLRLIQFFNSRAYTCCPGAATEDGFQPGPLWPDHT